MEASDLNHRGRGGDLEQGLAAASGDPHSPPRWNHLSYPSRSRTPDHNILYRDRMYKPFKEPRNRFPAWRNRFLASLNFYKYGLVTRKGRFVNHCSYGSNGASKTMSPPWLMEHYIHCRRTVHGTLALNAHSYLRLPKSANSNDVLGLT